MYQIIKALFASDRSNQIAFKGWTLAYFLYDLDRFSIDIDLDFLAGLPTGDQSKDIDKILTTYGHIKELQKFRNMHRYIFSYGNGEHNIKIECNTRIRKANTYETSIFFGDPIQVMDRSSMFANKLVAVIDRDKPTSRDLRDIHFFFTHHFPINKEVIEERMTMDMQTFFTALKHYILQTFISAKVVDANLWVVLNDTQKSRAKKSLIPEIINYIDLQLFELRDLKVAKDVFFRVDDDVGK